MIPHPLVSMFPDRFAVLQRAILIFILAIMFVFAGQAYATVWYVHPDSALNAIQAGLDSCTAGDTVLVGAGIYYENIIWPYVQGISFISEHGPDTTIIDGNEDGTVIHMSLMQEDSTTTINGFTIQNGYDWYGGGIYSVGGKPLISNNIIRNNVCEWPSKDILTDGPPPQGGGIYTEWSSAVIVDNLIIENSAQNGGGIACFCDAANIATTIVNNTITSNTADNGGGIYMDCPFTMCVIRDNTISYNTAYNGGGIACYYVFQPLLTIRKNVITYNTADSAGGGIWCYVSSKPFIDSCTIAYNIGDGIYSGHFSAPIINFNNIVDNDGCGVRNGDSSVTVMAEHNWWGDATGPYHPTNPGGTGDTVSDYVDFDPWLTEPVGVEEHQSSISAQMVLQVYPNPFRTLTEISVGTGHSAERLEINIYDATGRLVSSYRPSPYVLRTTLVWDGKDDTGRRVPAGIYFVKLDTENSSITQKVLIVR
ncbi:MAG: right-handed parallel beta-helix repeat-containing protein [candidate division WOR-3 bacterium]|nr:MAG: right-handed parallel beta-helix repeat-containing protein [candidate division WOR-3 bacterium]